MIIARITTSTVAHPMAQEVCVLFNIMYSLTFSTFQFSILTFILLRLFSYLNLGPGDDDQNGPPGMSLCLVDS